MKILITSFFLVLSCVEQNNNKEIYANFNYMGEGTAWISKIEIERKNRLFNFSLVQINSIQIVNKFYNKPDRIIASELNKIIKNGELKLYDQKVLSHIAEQDRLRFTTGLIILHDEISTDSLVTEDSYLVEGSFISDKIELTFKDNNTKEILFDLIYFKIN